MKRFRFYRFLRVLFAVVTTFPRYALLVWRERVRWLPTPSEAAWDRGHRKAANAMYHLGLGLGGLIVKLCQIAGARADVFPKPFIERLRCFYDRVPARPFAALRPYVERSLGRPLERLFRSVDEQPLASASLAQVHRAELLDGSQVVIKIQYPEIARLMRVDLKLVRFVLRMARWLAPNLDLRSLVNEVARLVALELDFEREATATERVRKALADEPELARVPKVHREFSSDKVLVLEYLEGLSVSDPGRIARTHDAREVAKRIARVYFEMIFEHGFFHGDPHPGNLLVLPDGAIGLLDFGLATQLPAGFSDGVRDLFVGAVSGDSTGAMEAARRLGFDVEALDAAALRPLVQILLGDYPKDKSALELLSVVSLAKIPPEFGLLVRTMVLLNGLSHLFAPGERVIGGELMRALSGPRRVADRAPSAPEAAQPRRTPVPEAACACAG